MNLCDIVIYAVETKTYIAFANSYYAIYVFSDISLTLLAIYVFSNISLTLLNPSHFIKYHIAIYRSISAICLFCRFHAMKTE